MEGVGQGWKTSAWHTKSMEGEGQGWKTSAWHTNSTEEGARAGGHQPGPIIANTGGQGWKTSALHTNSSEEGGPGLEDIILAL